MEQIFSFVLGIVIVALPYAVVVVFKTRKEVNGLTTENQNLIKYIDNEINSTHFNIDEIYKDIKNVEDVLDKKIDSRTDKMESRLEDKINDLVAFTDLSQHAIEKLQYQLAELQVSFENLINKKG